MLETTKRIFNTAKFIAILWVIEICDILFNLDLNRFGIIPRKVIGLRGIIFAPFLHADLQHLASNTITLFILLVVLNTFYNKISLNVTIFIILLNGLLVWIFAREAIHIGASGLIFGIAAFLMAIGFFKRSYTSILISLVIILLYRGLIWGMFPTSQENISWEAHLTGAIAGLFIAYTYRKRKIKVEKEAPTY